ncbi:3-isopropylmalate dehydratase small subunit [Marininema halotolerans]|uniref:3-isopropylmalate dehydratase small subunit n=1 Tax=Marininema halotolerans TaxID=1155944 RepID=A0A1I6PYF0_9BACL|nr:3-isopropylmalate dehydratase small subunit [Marininema halotolerans]SFS45080.1 3-isopropylmalate/(R)-2-methylmalate dehydratase small subunit [Marininema halotolerans]
MKPIRQHQGIVASLDRANVDTDQIIPKQFLKRIERTGFGQFLFYNWRFDENGKPDPTFELNKPSYDKASILVTGPNFGCGSSREHAPWALLDAGFHVIIAPSYADIFYNNCFKNGILPITLPQSLVSQLHSRIESAHTATLMVDLEKGTLTDHHGFAASFEIEPYRRHCLLNGMDDIAITLQKDESIQHYEQNRPLWYSIPNK